MAEHLRLEQLALDTVGVPRRRFLRDGLLVVALLCAGAGPAAAAGPSPHELRRVDPTGATGRATDERRPTTEAARRSPPSSAVGGAGSGDGGTPLSFGVLLGGLAGAIVLLGLAALPRNVAVRLAGWRVDRRLDLAVAGGVVLLVATVAYVVSAY